MGKEEVPFSTGVNGNSKYFAQLLNTAKPISEEGIDIMDTHPAV